MSRSPEDDTARLRIASWLPDHISRAYPSGEIARTFPSIPIGTRCSGTGCCSCGGVGVGWGAPPSVGADGWAEAGGAGGSGAGRAARPDSPATAA